MYISLWTISSNTLYLLFAFVLLSAVVLVAEAINRRKKFVSSAVAAAPSPPGPRKFPIIGNLNVLDGYEVPYQAFSDLGKKYGQIVKLQLGSVPAVVVNGIDNIKEVLITKTNHFDSRPNFQRYHRLFSGNKENSLAFCDWSDLHKLRRDMLTPHTFPKSFSTRFQDLNGIISQHTEHMMTQFNASAAPTQTVNIKEYFLKSSANIFNEYFCSKTIDYNDQQLDTFISNFDRIFYEVNQGYAADFMPFLMTFHKSNMQQMDRWSHQVRDIILEKIIGDRLDTYANGMEEKDYLDSLIAHIKEERLPSMSWDTALFALEDILGGHAAVGNFLTIVCKYLIDNPRVQLAIQKEIDETNHNANVITLDDRKSMPYTQAVLMESLRMIASPIVPHVSNQATTINGYHVPEKTLIFLNNYETNMSSDLWDEPEQFKPERFLNEDGNLFKPDHFLPFGAGKRSCMGYKFVQFISFSMITNLLKTHTIKSGDFKIQPGSLAVSDLWCPIVLESRV